MGYAKVRKKQNPILLRKCWDTLRNSWMTFKVSFDTEMPFLLSSCLVQMRSLLYFSLKPWRQDLQEHIMKTAFGVKPLCTWFFVMEFLIFSLKKRNTPFAVDRDFFWREICKQGWSPRGFFSPETYFRLGNELGQIATEFKGVTVSYFWCNESELSSMFFFPKLKSVFV